MYQHWKTIKESQKTISWQRVTIWGQRYGPRQWQHIVQCPTQDVDCTIEYVVEIRYQVKNGSQQFSAVFITYLKVLEFWNKSMMMRVMMVMVVVVNGSQHTTKAPTTMPRVIAALCSRRRRLRLDLWPSTSRWPWPWPWLDSAVSLHPTAMYFIWTQSDVFLVIKLDKYVHS